jgi:hypothetical protein
VWKVGKNGGFNHQKARLVLVNGKDVIILVIVFVVNGKDVIILQV